MSTLAIGVFAYVSRRTATGSSAWIYALSTSDSLLVKRLRKCDHRSQADSNHEAYGPEPLEDVARITGRDVHSDSGIWRAEPIRLRRLLGNPRCGLFNTIEPGIAVGAGIRAELSVRVSLPLEVIHNSGMSSVSEDDPEDTGNRAFSVLAGVAIGRGV